MAKIFVVLAIAFIIGCYYMNKSYNEAMEACQVEHSYDTCFYSLNR